MTKLNKSIKLGVFLFVYFFCIGIVESYETIEEFLEDDTTYICTISYTAKAIECRTVGEKCNIEEKDFVFTKECMVSDMVGDKEEELNLLIGQAKRLGEEWFFENFGDKEHYFLEFHNIKVDTGTLFYGVGR